MSRFKVKCKGRRSNEVNFSFLSALVCLCKKCEYVTDIPEDISKVAEDGSDGEYADDFEEYDSSQVHSLLILPPWSSVVNVCSLCSKWWVQSPVCLSKDKTKGLCISLSLLSVWRVQTQNIFTCAIFNLVLKKVFSKFIQCHQSYFCFINIFAAVWVGHPHTHTHTPTVSNKITRGFRKLENGFPNTNFI